MPSPCETFHHNYKTYRFQDQLGLTSTPQIILRNVKCQKVLIHHINKWPCDYFWTPRQCWTSCSSSSQSTQARIALARLCSILLQSCSSSSALGVYGMEPKLWLGSASYWNGASARICRAISRLSHSVKNTEQHYPVVLYRPEKNHSVTSIQISVLL